MNQTDFNLLPESEQLKLFVQALKTSSHVDIFGTTRPKTVYKTLAKLLHPDKGGSDEAFALLAERWEDEPTVEHKITLNGTTYTLGVPLGEGVVSTVYAARNDSGRAFALKMGNSADTDDLIQNEYNILVDFSTQPNFNEASRYLPVPVGQTKINGAKANLFGYEEQYLADASKLIPLSVVADSFENGIPLKQIGWIWRRMLAVLDFAHYYGVIHANINPNNILLDLADEGHGLVLIDWIAASKGQAPVTVLDPEFESFYPPEIRDKQLPLPSSDFYMAAKTMVAVSEPMPEAMARYFNWLMVGTQAMRLDNTRTLMDQWTDVMYLRLGWRREFIPMPYTPRQVDWAWFQHD